MEVTTQCDGTRGRTAGFFLPLYGTTQCIYNSRKKSHTMFEFHRNERARQLRPSLSRSWLLVRANSTEEVFEEAFESEADSIIIDLEDGCPAEEKDAAREQVVRMLNSGVVAWVRINAITTEHWWKDVKALKNVKGLRGVMLATAEHATDIDRTAAELPAGTPIIALIESALGVHHSVEIARAIGTFRLAFGAGDYRRDTGSSATPMALAYVRSQLVIASTLGGLPGPIDGPTLGAYGADLSKACGFANDHGMTGKITLDIRQTETINAAFSPSEIEIEEAHQMLDVPLDGPRDGSYLPRYLRAKKVKELAKVYGLWGKTDSDFQRASK